MQNYFWKIRLMMVKILFTLIVISSQIFSQQNNQLLRDFNLAINLYETLQYEKAFEAFDKITSSYNYNSKTTVSQLFKAKCLNEMQRFSEAEEILMDLIKNYPESKYLDEARVVLSNSYFKSRNYAEAFETFVIIINSSKNEYYIDYSKEAGEDLALSYLNSKDISIILDTASSNELRPYLLLIIAKLNIKLANYSDAKQNLNDLAIDYPLSQEKDEALQLLSEIKGKESTKVDNSVVAVLLPLSGENLSKESSDVASEILEGIKYAISDFNKEHTEKIGLLIKNTANKREEISKIKNELQKISTTKAIIGPVFSNEVREALKTFEGIEIPIISPTATDNDLTSLNEFFFQANPPFSVRGKIMAQYLFFVENKRKIGVLNSIDGYSPMIANNFIEEFESLGGQVLIQQTYKSKSVSLAEPVSKITEFAGSLEGIYLPLADKSDAPVILSALAQEEISLSLYGNQDWLLVNSLQSYLIANNNLTITSDYFLEFNDEGFQQFSKDFFAVTGKDVNRNMLYGYDTAKYLLTILRNTYGTGRAVKEKIESGVVASGFHNNISFSKERVNRFLNIIHFNNGKFELIDKFRASN